MTDRMTLPQGDVGLLDTDLALTLLTSTIPARVAYTAADGTPRVYTAYFVWNGSELVMGTYAGAFKIRALREQPDVAITIDTDGFPPQALLLRGRAEVIDVDGVVPEYAEAWRRYVGVDVAEQVVADMDQPGLRMARVAVRPRWAGLLDFEGRLPAAMGGVQ